jgi:hypothetical protein
VAAKKEAAVRQLKAAPVKRESALKAGTGSKRVKTRVITLYGPPKTGKTTAASTLPIGNTKWLITDQNCIPTLDSADRLPPDEDIYEITSLSQAKNLLLDMIDCAKEDSLGRDYVVFDSLTALADIHQTELARLTGQRFLGDNQKNNGWQLYNAEFGTVMDILSDLGRYVTVVCIAHSAAKSDPTKGDYHGLNLTPKMAERAGRTGNWILYMTATSTSAEDGDEDTEFSQILETPSGKRRIERVIHTVPVGFWPAAASSRVKLDPEEPPDIYKLLKKAGLA